MRATVSGTISTTIVLVAIAICVIATPPALASDKKSKKSEVEKRPFQVLRPTVELSPTQGYDAVREIGGVRIELTSTQFESKPMYFVSVQKREDALESWTGVRVNDLAPVWVGVLPFFEVTPRNVELKLRITNHLGRVLRLEGVALQFVKDGEALDVGETANALGKVLILPEKSWEGTLSGPTLQAFGLKEFDARTSSAGLLKDAVTASEGTLLIGIYDVITEVDEASNPKKRSNFEWVFAYKAKATPEDAEAMRWKARLTTEQMKQIVGNHSPEEFNAMLPGGQAH
ncbi:MAG TPA: hypothetical protein VFV19_18875 [Candidatus Polarisedimenticolaceae bacterium]|nr:hypothetical protein [Candidatus Polarisedimenticolaceae bacterium]